MPQPYVGRFAPSPSGPLHLGSLVCALASYLDAKAHNGQWLVRMEDIDPVREQAGAADSILQTLEAHGLEWDSDVRYQSTRSDAYMATLDKLDQQGLTYRCSCTRKRLNTLDGRYDGFCRQHPPAVSTPAAMRLIADNPPEPFRGCNAPIEFHDRVVGTVNGALTEIGGDFIIHRKDGMFAYQLAVVVDDIDQRVSHIVRGDDLLNTTAKQIYLYRLLGHRVPSFAHIPVVVDECGHKLCKQLHAPAINNKNPRANLIQALQHLSIPIESSTKDMDVKDILAHGVEIFRTSPLSFPS